AAVHLPDQTAPLRGAPEPEPAARHRCGAVPQPARLPAGPAGSAGGGGPARHAPRPQAAVRIRPRARPGVVVVRQPARAARVAELLLPRRAGGVATPGDGARDAAALDAPNGDLAHPAGNTRADDAASAAATPDDGAHAAGEGDARSCRRAERVRDAAPAPRAC